MGSNVKHYCAIDVPIGTALEDARSGNEWPAGSCVDVTLHPFCHALTPKRRALIMQRVLSELKKTCAIFITVENGTARAVDEYLDELRAIRGI